MSFEYISTITSPTLPTGVSGAAVNDDQLNGAGVNDTISPDMLDTFETCTPLILTSDMTDVFVTECPDVVFPCANNEITFPQEIREIEIRRTA